MTDRESIFLSHKSPGDNYFAAWLASKLKLLGYTVWIELDELKSGDAFWPEIDSAIRTKTIKFLAIVSKSYLQTVNDPLSGVFKELSTADRVRDIKRFKAALKIDDVNEDDFPPQLMGLHTIDFYSNWQTGLERLLESFEKEKIPKQDVTDNPLNFWMDAFKIKDIQTNVGERIYTNWFPVELPDKLYIHKPIIKTKLDLADVIFPYTKYSDRHICFFPASDYPASINVSSTVELNVREILDEQVVAVDDFVALNQPRKKIIELLNKVFVDFLFESGLKKYEQSKGLVFYYSNYQDNGKRVSLKSVGKTNVSITGRTRENRWSFAISSFAILHPFPCIRINSHIIFESKEFVLLDTDEQSKLRRKYGFDWYNRDWLDTLLGMMIKISGNAGDSKIRMPISSSEKLIMDCLPFSVETDFGYVEPEKEEKEND